MSKEWEESLFGLTLRCYRSKRIERLNQQIEQEQSVCLIAPPGSGKTVCALALASELERFVEISDQQQPVEQWRRQISKHPSHWEPQKQSDLSG